MIGTADEPWSVTTATDGKSGARLTCQWWARDDADARLRTHIYARRNGWNAVRFLTWRQLQPGLWTVTLRVISVRGG